MTANNDVLRHIVLDVISTARPVSASRLTALSHDNWLSILEMAKQHRIGPMLHSRCQSASLGEAIPVFVAEQWAAAYRKSAFRYLSFRKTLDQLRTILDEAEIPFAALKGAWLAQHAYRDPALRPMRDVDLLVPPSCALETYNLLNKNGFVRDKDYPMPLGNAIFDAKHLPAMRCCDSGLHIEVHSRIMTVQNVPIQPETLDDVAFLLSRREYQNGVPYLSPTDTLLHLVVHAAYDHQFNNGPITFYDIAVLLNSAPIDWPKFWQMTAAGGWSRGCVLIFELASHYHKGDVWRDYCNVSFSHPSKSQIESAALLSLQDFDHRGVVSLRAEMAAGSGVLNKASRIFRRSFPSLHRLAGFAGKPTASYWSALHYPQWLLSQIVRLFGKNDASASNLDVKRATRVRHWLHADN
jgi:hypothetical protein